MSKNPYAVPVPASPAAIGDENYPDVTVRIAPYHDGCEALIEVGDTTYIINETQDVYAELWHLIDVITGDVECEYYTNRRVNEQNILVLDGKCHNKVYKTDEQYCTDHEIGA